MTDQIQNTNGIIDLNGTWAMKDYTIGIGYQKKVYLSERAAENCLPCKVPGTVRAALLEDGEIPDPYYGYDNEKSLWVEEKEWWFFRKFTVVENFKGKNISLVFEGTSFSGACWLNGRRIGNLNGMLNPRSFDVSSFLKFGEENFLAVRLEAPPDARERIMEKGLTWRSPRDQMHSIAQCVYGWDWGPHGVSVGIWQPVRLIATGSVRIENPYILSKILSKDQAECNVKLQVRNLTAKSVKVLVAGKLISKNSSKEAAEFKRTANLKPNQNKTMNLKLVVRHPELWWPNGMGKQNLYTLNANVCYNNHESDNLTAQFGIRELKMVENQNIGEFLKTMGKDLGDAHHLGKVVGSYPWTFLVNGKKMYAKGGNWIPGDQLLRLDREKYDRLLKLFKDAHFNLMRVWGGGLYETDDFYNLCDEYGILTWQEFLSNRNFSKIDRDNFLDGVKSSVLRLRNHPSLTFWCGGNEFDPDDKGSKNVIDSLESLLKKYDPQREFHRASPYMGDDHYWGVWHRLEPYTNYRVVRPFRSEAGLNAPPAWENYVKFTPENLMWPPDSTFIEYHGESDIRFAHLKKMMRYADEFGESSNMKELITKSQLYQAIGNEFDMEFCRANKFKNSGFLVWQYNDIWPCLSWSVVDWYGTPKPSYYFLKRAARPVHISADYKKYLWNAGETFKAGIYLLNDMQSRIKNLTYKAEILGCSGKILGEKSGPAGTSANRSKKIGNIEFNIPDSLKGKTFFVSAKLIGKSGETVSDTLYPIAVSGTDNPDYYRNIFSQIYKMPKIRLKVEVLNKEFFLAEDGSGSCKIRITNSTGNLAFFIGARLVEESAGLRTVFDDNYISLLPRESKILSVRLESINEKAIPGKIHFEISGINCPVRIIEMDIEQYRK